MWWSFSFHAVLLMGDDARTQKSVKGARAKCGLHVQLVPRYGNNNKMRVRIWSAAERTEAQCCEPVTAQQLPSKRISILEVV